MFKERFIKLLISLPLLDKLGIFLISKFICQKSFSSSISDTTAKPKKKKHVLSKSDLTEYEWVIKISAPSGASSKFWGDKYFAEQLSKSLENLGYKTRIIFRNEDIKELLDSKSINLTIRGLLPLPLTPGAINLIWVISHPNQISKRELKNYDMIFAASKKWAADKSKKWNLSIIPLLQATSPTVFNPNSEISNTTEKVLFVGNTRGKLRKSVKAATKVKANLKIIGKGWNKFIDPASIENTFIANNELSAEYRKAKAVLNDHWPDMSSNGFISNRLFDAVASGARVISDQVDGISEIFKNQVIEYSSPKELEQILESDFLAKFAAQEILDELAKEVLKEHNFDRRAEVLVASVKKLIKEPN